MTQTKSNKAAVDQLWHDAHPLRDAVLRSGATDDRGYPVTDLDYLGTPTAGRITVGAAVAKYGLAVVRKAVEAGRVYPVRVETRPAYASGADGCMVYPSPDGLVDPRRVADRPWTVRLEWADARPEDRLTANGVQVG